jgi:hypothetical protein
VAAERAMRALVDQSLTDLKNAILASAGITVDNA